MRRIAVVLVLVGGALLLSGCLGDDAGNVANEIVHVSEVAGLPDGRVTLVGTGVAQSGEARLCAAVMESHPPQCGQPSVLIEGFDLEGMDGTQTAGGVTWTDGEIQLNGKLGDGVLRADG